MEIRINARLHPAQLVIHNNPARFRVCCCGRKFGKTRLGVLECLGAASQGKHGWWVAPTYKITEVGWRPLYSMAGKIPGAQRYKSDKMIVLPGGGWVGVRSADSDQGLRSEGLDFVVIDEAAFIQHGIWSQQIRPNLTATEGWAMFISTPWGLNWFYDLYRRGAAQEQGWASFHYPTAANPYIKPEEIESARRELPELIFRQEYMADFVNMEGSVFRKVQDACKITEIETPIEGHQYIGSADVASLEDFTVVCIIDVADKSMVHIERFNRVDYDVLEDRLDAIYKHWKLTALTIEANSIGQGVIDHLTKREMVIIPFITTNATKQAIVTRLQSAFEHSEIKIIPHPVLIGELLSFEGKRNPSGSFSYSAPEGMHDDCAMSLAIGWYSMGVAHGTALVAFAG